MYKNGIKSMLMEHKLNVTEDDAFLLNKSKLKKVNDYFKTSHTLRLEDNFNDKIKEICVSKLCDAIGIKCAYNYKNVFFDFFSTIMGEAISTKLNLNLGMDKYNLKYLRFDDVNIINSATSMLDLKEVDEAIIDVYELADNFKWVISTAF